MAKVTKPFQPKEKKARFPQMQLDFLAQFRELLDVNVSHSFFAEKEFPPNIFHIRPTEMTMLYMKQNTLQFRAMPSGFMIGFGSTDTYSPLRKLEAPLHLSYLMEIHDPQFLTYTDLPFKIDNTRVFYFNNLGLEKDDSEHMNLSKERYVTDEDRIDVMHPRFVHKFDEPQYDGVEVEVMNAVGEVVFSKILEEGAMACDINLLDYPEAKYTLSIDGIEEMHFFTYSGLRPVFGVVDIIIDPDAFDDYSFYNDEGELVRQKYFLNFKTRSVRWNYILVEQSRHTMHTDHQVYDSIKKSGYIPIPFTNVETEEWDGKEVKSVWTDVAIPMRERQPQKFKIKTKRGKSGVEWIQPLPNAMASSNLKVNKSDPDEVYSELIVYL